MRFKTFRALAIGGGLLGVFGVGTAGIWLVQSHSQHLPATSQKPPQDVQTAAPAVTASQVSPMAAAGPGTALRPEDREILAKLKTPIAGDKLKDALHGSKWKVNLYQDAGKSTPNRLKIDFNRNEKYDEKWSVDGKTIKREVAPSDDEKYTQEYILSPDGSQWLASKNAAPVAAVTERVALDPPLSDAAVDELLANSTSQVEPATPAGSIPLRRIDSIILERAQRGISGDKVKDAIPGQDWKVNLYQDAGQTKVNRLKIDLDRDDKWDEKWTFTTEGGRDEVKREVAPADDEKYTVEYRLRSGAWVKKTP